MATKTLTITGVQAISTDLKVSNLDFNADSAVVTTAENVLRIDNEDFNFKKNGTIRIV